MLLNIKLKQSKDTDIDKYIGERYKLTLHQDKKEKED